MPSSCPLRATCLVLALSAAACGTQRSSTSSAQPDAGDGSTLDDGATTLGPSPTLAAFCSALVSAGTRAYVAAHPEACDPVSDPADWQYGPQAYCDVMAHEVSSGHLVFDPTQAAACVASVQAASASMSRDLDFPQCRAAVAGQLDAGQPCYAGSPLELSEGVALPLDGRPLISTCASGLYCAQLPADASPAAARCGGVCAPIARANETCLIPGGCPGVSFCTTPCEHGSVCAGPNHSGLCVPRAGQGEPCNLADEDMCEDGLFCAADLTGGVRHQTVCKPQLPASAPCSGTTSDECAPPNVCRATPGSDAGFRCSPVPLLKDGEACTLGGPGLCVCPSACIEGTCATPVNVGASPCTLFGTTELPCRGGTCDLREGDGGTCVANVAPGQACDPGFPAACAYESCDPQSRRCTPDCSE